MDEASDIPTKRRIDGITAVMVSVTALSLVGAAWLHVKQQQPDNQSLSVDSVAPPLRLLDLDTGEPIVLVGLRGKIVWVVFLSVGSPTGEKNLAAVAQAGNSFKVNPRFSMVVAAVDGQEPGRVRAAVAASGVTLPVYLASDETRRRFGLSSSDEPLQVLINAEGRIASLARGTSPQTNERLASQARRLLDELPPHDDTRFASAISVYWSAF